MTKYFCDYCGTEILCARCTVRVTIEATGSPTAYSRYFQACQACAPKAEQMLRGVNSPDFAARADIEISERKDSMEGRR